MPEPADVPPKQPLTASVLSVSSFADLTAELLRNIDQPAFLCLLGTFFERILRFDNYIVYRYQEGCAAELIHTNLDFAALRSSMAPYISGLYLLDPFYITATAGRRRGVLRMQDIAPAAFTESDYFGMFYKNVNVVDEVRFVVELHGEELIHVFLERAIPSPRYEDEDLETLRGLENFVNSFIERHWEWRNMSESVRGAARAPLAFGLRNVIGNLKRKALTAREIDIVELTIKGHSAKSIAHELDISEGTVINHKRNIYGKLEISSQSQLFHLFLQALYSNASP